MEDLIMPGDGSMGGAFSLVPEGDIDEGTGIEMEFTGKIEPYGEEKDGLRFEACYVDDPSAKASIFCKMTEQRGLIKMLDIINSSGVAEKLRKVGKLKSDPSKGMSARILTDPKFHEQLKLSIEGCRILTTVKHSAGTYKGKDVTNANINKIASVNGRKAPSQPSSPGTDTEEESW